MDLYGFSVEGYIQVYRRRYLVLGIFFMNSAMSALASMQYTSVTEASMAYYSVSVDAVNWTVLVYACTCATLLFPGIWFLDKEGLRSAVIAASIFHCLGSGIKLVSLDPSRFYLVIISQIIISIGQIFLFPVPSLLAGDWFGANEISKATAIAVLSTQLGAGFSFLVPTLVVGETVNPSEIERRFQLLEYIYFGISSIILLVTVFGMRRKPPSPPSFAAALKEDSIHDVNNRCIPTIKRLMRNKNFILHMVAFAINVSVLYTVGPLFTQICLMYFPGKLREIGWIGMVMILSGILPSVFTGCFLDRTRCYKLTALVTYGSCIVSIFVLGDVLHVVHNVKWLYIPSIMIGFSFTSYLSTGYEFGSEITYPELESTTTGLMYTLVQILSLVLMPIATQITPHFSHDKDLIYLIIFIVMLIVGLILTAFVQPTYRRHDAETNRIFTS